MSNLQKILTDVQHNKSVAKTEKDHENPIIKNRLRDNQMTAKRNLDNLFLNFRKELLKHAVLIVNTGKNLSKFSEIASEYGCLVVDQSSYVSKFNTLVQPGLYTNGTGVSSSLIDTIEASFEDVARELDIVSYPMFVNKKEYQRALNGKEDLNLVTEQVVMDVVGGETFYLMAINDLPIKVTNSDDTEIQTVYPIVLNVLNEDVAQAIVNDVKQSFTQNAFLVNLTGKLTEKKVEETLLDIRSNIKL